MQKEQTDILIIGAGPAGCVAASLVNKAGFKARIVDRAKFPRFVIGESLLPRCMDHFEEAGFLDALKSQGYQVKHGAVFLKDDKRCEFEFSEQFTKGYEWTWQIPRDHFDNVLAEEVQKMGVPIDFETTVTNVEFEGSNSTTTVTDKDGNEKQIKAKFVIDSSGYGRVLPRLLDLNIPSDQKARSTMFTQFKDENRPDNPDANRIVIVSHTPDVWIWIIPFSNGFTSVGFVGNPEFFEGREGSKEEILRSMLANEPKTIERFSKAEMKFDPVMINGYSISVKQLYGDGFALTGNASEFLDPVFSAGVTFATETGSIAAKLACRQLKGEDINWDEEYVKPVIDGIDVFRTYINGWYDGTIQKIFFADDPGQGNKNMICSVLAGYVWDQNNPYVNKHKKRVETLAKVIEIQSA
ncbi:MAG: flavin-dependent dehydrogenase [Granulosicoccus sp.]|jgi:flavin-dependent dehydrogenase